MDGAARYQGGFADPVRETQRTFRAILAALSEPGTVHAAEAAAPPAPMPAAMGAVALTLCDADTPVWLAPAYADAAPWLAAQTDAPITQHRAAARFALLDALPAALTEFALGSEAYPDRSATLVAAVPLAGPPVTLEGPGIDGVRELAVTLPEGFTAAWAANNALYPRGVDVILTDGPHLAGLPRTTRLTCTSR